MSQALEAKRSAAGESGQGDRPPHVPASRRSRGERIGAGEEEGIRERLKVLKDAARIKSSIEGVDRGLYEDEQSAHAPGRGVRGAPEAFFRHRVDRCAQEEDGSHLLRRGGHSPIACREEEKSLDYEPGELEALGERLSTIVRLKEKYGKTHGGIAEFEEWARKRLDELLHLKTDLAGLESEKTALRSRRRRDGGRLICAEKGRGGKGSRSS